MTVLSRTREGCRDKLQLRLRKSRDVLLLANAVIGVGTNPHPNPSYICAERLLLNWGLCSSCLPLELSPPHQPVPTAIARRHSRHTLLGPDALLHPDDGDEERGGETGEAAAAGEDERGQGRRGNG